MHGKNKLLLRFTKLIDKDCKALLKKGSYEVLLDGKSLGKLKSVKIHEEETEIRNRDEQDVKVSGVRSVILECSKIFLDNLSKFFSREILLMSMETVFYKIVNEPFHDIQIPVKALVHRNIKYKLLSSKEFVLFVPSSTVIFS